ncbi:MAG TPA: SdrD B-like domain-containing protein, partial [Saprospiraceae bacterium]|nr:SdrD B-like domain-containing protein [Saprospiraceae bacterium]
PILTFSDSVPSAICPSVNLRVRKWIATDHCGNSASCVQRIVINDVGSICGYVHDDLGQPISGVQIQLFVDQNNNQGVDTTDVLLASTFTDGSGNYCFTGLHPCQYVVVEMQPASYGNLSDYDSTPDPDGDDSLDGPDNEIPVALTPIEGDFNNNFTDVVCPATLPVLPFDTICSGQSVLLQISDLNLGTLTYAWNFGSGASPALGNGLGPYTITYILTTQNNTTGASVMLTISKSGCPDLVGEITRIHVNAIPNASINTGTQPVCYYTNKIFQPVAPLIPGATYQWSFGSGAVPLTATGYGPHTVYYTTSGTKTAKLVIYPNEPGAECPDSSTISFTILNCPAQVLGAVKSDEGVGISNVALRLYADANTDGIADNSNVVKIAFTNQFGMYAIASVVPGNYVVVETQPSGWNTVDDYDTTDDGDIAPNISGLDNLIPVTLPPNEIDSLNVYIESPQPGSITGNVFQDLNNNQLPDTGEGISGATLKVLPDVNTDGIADDSIPVAIGVSSSTGTFQISGVPIGNYVLVEMNIPDYLSFMDYD